MGNTIWGRKYFLFSIISFRMFDKRIKNFNYLFVFVHSFIALLELKISKNFSFKILTKPSHLFKIINNNGLHFWALYNYILKQLLYFCIFVFSLKNRDQLLKHICNLCCIVLVIFEAFLRNCHALEKLNIIDPKKRQTYAVFADTV